MKNYWNLKFIKIIVTSFFITSFQLVVSQNKLPQDSSRNLSSYLFPIYPGKQNFLAGSMGELRDTHFHLGLDIRTNNVIGAPVYCTQSGYISQVNIGTYGYGNTIKVTHPDGNISLYAHLDQLTGVLADSILKEQYAKKTFEINRTFNPTEFPVKRGDTIALSGNTGASGGPHLHFEIRDSLNNALNPLTFGFNEIKDNLPPVAIKIALNTLDINSRINDQFGRFEFSLVRTGNTYNFNAPILAHGKIGVEVLAYDIMDSSPFKCGITHIELFKDSTSIFTQYIDKINLEESRDIITALNFQILKTKGLRYNLLYVCDGNPLKIYKSVSSKGIISIDSGELKIRIALKDLMGNQSQVNFTLRYDPPIEKILFLDSPDKLISYQIIENTLALHAAICSTKSNEAIIYSKAEDKHILPSYSSSQKNVYLIDLRKNLPDSIQTCGGKLVLNFKDVIPSKKDYTYSNNYLDITFTNDNLYDTLYLSTDYKLSLGKEIFSIGKSLTPIHKQLNITIKPKVTYPFYQKTSVYRVIGKRLEYLGGTWVDHTIQFTTNELGVFTLLTDYAPPRIKKNYCTHKSVQFRISDNLSGIASFEATINGEWLLMIYDYKTGIIQSKKQNKEKKLTGILKLRVKDRSGNETLYTQKIH